MTIKFDKNHRVFDTHRQRLRDYEWALGLNRMSLRLMGVWPDTTSETDSQYIHVPMMILTVFVCMVLPQMYALVKVHRELPLVLDNLMTSSAACTSCFKLFFFWRSKHVLGPVIQSVIQDWMRPKVNWERETMLREAARARIFTIFGYVVIFGSYIGFAFAPVFGFHIRTISNITDYGDHHLFVQSYFPYDYSKSPYFEITHFGQLLAGIFMGMSLTIPDNYFAALVFHVSAQFEILGANMGSLIEEKNQEFKKDKYKGLNEKMGVFVERHVHLTTVVTAIEYSFSYVLMFQVLCMSMMVCCLGVQIHSLFTIESSHFRIVMLLGTLFTLMTHTFIACFASETLALRSSGIYRDVYNSLWYTVPMQGAKDMIPIMLASNSPRRLTAGKLIILSLSTYCGILKTTGGYISVLIAENNR